MHAVRAVSDAHQAGIDPDYQELTRIGLRCIREWCDKRFEHGNETDRKEVQHIWAQLESEINQIPGYREQYIHVISVLGQIPDLNNIFHEEVETLEVSEG